MKKHEDTIREVHRRINEYEAEKKLRRTRNFKIAAAVTPVCAAAVVGVGLWKGGALSSDNAKMSGSNANIIATEQNTTEVNTVPAVVTTEATIKQNEPATAEVKTTEAIPTQQETTEAAVKQTEPVTAEAKTTEAVPTQQETTEAAVKQTEPVTAEIKTTEAVPVQQETTEAAEYPNGTQRDMLAVKSVNGIVYLQFISSDVYTCGEYIGESSEFIGFPEQGSLYRSNESPDVIILRYGVDQATLKKTDISPEQYQQEYEQLKEMIDSKQVAF
jgi:hypothetical protein